MLMWSLSLAGGMLGADRTCSVLYGFAVSMMWLRILDFVLVQKDLGQVLKGEARRTRRAVPTAAASLPSFLVEGLSCMIQ